MLKDFVANASLLVSSFFIIGMLLNSRFYKKCNALCMKIASGICFGLQGVLVIAYAIRINEWVVVDLRHLPTIAAAVWGGPVSAVIAAAIISAARIYLVGFSFPAVTSAVSILLIGLTSALIARNKAMTNARFLWINIIAMLYVSVTISINLYQTGSLDRLIEVLITHWILSISIGIVCFYVFLHVVRIYESNVKLKNSEESYRKLITASPDATFVLNNERIEFVNEKGIKLLSAPSRKDLLGRSILEFVHPSCLRDAQEHWEAIKTGAAKTELMEEQFIRLDGTVIDVELSVSEIIYNREIAHLATVRDITERKLMQRKLQEALETLQKLSDLDGLTGIPNRRKFDALLRKAWSTCLAEQKPISVMMFDVDYFKLYNDTYGHLGGDEALRNIALTSSAILMKNSHFIARYGGEEFAIVLIGVSPEEAQELAESLRVHVERLAIPHAKSKISDRVTISLGLATVIPDANEAVDERELIRWADSALYQAKAEGRNRIAVYSNACKSER